MLAEDRRLARVTWRDVQKGLEPHEGAVEFVRFQFSNGKKWTPAVYYAALIVTAKSITAPTFVMLGDEGMLLGPQLRDYRQGVGPRGPSAALANGSFYKAFWQPLEAALADAKRIYVAPDGLLNQVSFGIVTTSDGRLLMEKYHLRMVLSTKDILRQKHEPSSNTAVLIGNPQFDMDEAQQRIALRGLLKPGESKALIVSAWVTGRPRSLDQEGGSLIALPGTQVELDSVRSLLKKRHWQVETYTGAAAVEETVKRVEHPRVLHLATHGFFLPDHVRLRTEIAADLPSGSEDPMLRSGLFFAGANRALLGAPSPPDLDDGVLTAYGATGLNLQGTELVVLSACDTGLGQMKNGEGVFGLRRAFQEAGAESVLMSLWAAPDRETQEMMALFYDKWLSGMDKHEALCAAQFEMRRMVEARYGQDLPFFWGGFVLVGG